MRRPDALVLAVFVAVTVIGGSNFVAVRFSNRELAPFWGAAARFGIAALVLLAAMAIARIPVPRGRGLRAAAEYGLLNYAANYAFAYWGLVAAPAALGAVMISMSPLITIFLAAAYRLERLTARAVFGALIALAGVALIFADRIGSVPLVSVAALLASATAGTLANVRVKRMAVAHPVSMNAIGMLVGAPVLLALSLLAGEPRVVPAQPATVAAFAYLALVASPLLFVGVIFVVRRWTASATSYATVLMPLVAVVLGALLAGETVGALFVVGTAVVLAGVYLGALAPAREPAQAVTVPR